MVGGEIQLLARLAFGTVGNLFRLKAGLQPFRYEVIGLFFVLALGRWEILATLGVFHRCQLAHQVTVADAHVDDELLGAAGRAEQVVHDRQLQQLPDVGLVLDRGHIRQRDAQGTRNGFGELGPGRRHDTACTRRHQACRADGYLLFDSSRLVEVERSAVHVDADAQHLTNALDTPVRSQHQYPGTFAQSGMSALQADAFVLQACITLQSTIDDDPCLALLSVLLFFHARLSGSF
ncbi:hypothetical protein [Pseudomonas aeruginosa]|uniref:hypothetical protein n=1 Tax=Pseudomonas aeruginosa TaxID=287 RepID=UPI003D26A545